MDPKKDTDILTNEKQMKDLFLFRLAHISKMLFKELNRQLSTEQIPVLAEQIPILLTIYHHSESITQQLIADKLLRDKGGIHRSIKSLAQEGFLIVRVDSSDKRKNIVSLTRLGNYVCEKVKSFALDFNNQLLENLNAHEHSTLLRLLEKVSSMVVNPDNINVNK